MAWRTQAWYTQERGGFSRGDIITGRIVHIKRTEWLWAELNTVVSVHFSSLFTYMENKCIQGSTDELHIFCLCYIYLQKSKGSCKIQTSVEKSTQGGQTLFSCGREVASAGTMQHILTGRDTSNISEDTLLQFKMAKDIFVEVNDFI